MEIVLIGISIVLFFFMGILAKDECEGGTLGCLFLGLVFLIGGIAYNSHLVREEHAIEIGIGEYYFEGTKEKFRYKDFVQKMIDEDALKKLEEKKKNITERIEKMKQGEKK